MATKPKTVNQLLCESKERIAVSEKLAPVIGTVQRIGPVSESMGPDGQDVSGLYEAKIWHADKPNGNGRIYTRECMQENINRLKPAMAKGGFCGSVDHGTGLTTQCIMWRDCWMNDKGEGFGRYEVVPTRDGQDLKAQQEAKMLIGFSTYGYGSARIPTDADRTKYNLPESDSDYDEEGNYQGPVIMADSYELAKCDAVDLPSVPDARIIHQQSNPTAAVTETGNVATVKGIPITEACSNGLHWIERASCGHVLSECKCKDDKKYTVWADRVCDRCKKAGESLSVEQFKALMTESKPKRAAMQEGKHRPLAKRYAQYIGGEDSYEPIGNVNLVPELTSDAYEIVPTWTGVSFVRKPVQTDELYHFEGSPMESVLKEIDTFWGLKEEYEKYGVMFHRGIIMYGAPGTGKTSAVNQAVDMVTSRGDVVFYGKSVSALKEGLKAFREVEANRKVVVVLEDADEYVGYQEREMLNLLDGADTIEGCLYLATTNYLNRFPERLLRPGRFDKKVHIGPPNLAGRTAYFQRKLGKVETAEEIADLAKQTDGLSFGHLREVITAIYALKEPKSEVLARLRGSAKSANRESRLTEHMAGNVATESTGSIHLNHACVGKAMAAVRAGKVDHGSFDGGSIERTSANADKFLGTDTAFTPDEKGHYKFPIFTGNKVSAKGVGSAGHYSEGTHPEIHAATVKISDAIKEHEGAETTDPSNKESSSKPESVMSEQVQKALNTFLESVKGSPDIELPQREVLPAEIAAQLEAKDTEIADQKAEIEKIAASHKAAMDKVLAEKAELQAKLDAIEAERVEDKRLADVMTKASELLKDNAFSDTIVEDIKELAADKSFTAEKVDAVVKSRTARYEKAVGVKTTKEIPLGIQGKLVNDSDLPGTSEAEAELAAKQDGYVVEPASELKF